jgi:hypothetical protein
MEFGREGDESTMRGPERLGFSKVLFEGGLVGGVGVGFLNS